MDALAPRVVGPALAARVKAEKAKRDFIKAYRKLFSPARYKVFYGGRGAGRSWQVARYYLIRGAEERIRVLCGREFQTSISDSVHRLLVDQIRLLGLDALYDIQKTEIRGINGTLFLFEGLHRNVTKIKSMEGLDAVWVEEAEKVTNDSWEVLIPTVRKKGSEITITFNPDDETDPTYVRFIKNTPPNSIVQKTTWRDNPHIPDTLLREKDYLFRVDPDAAAHVWDGECRSQTDAQVLRGKYRIDAFDVPTNRRGEPAWDGPYFGADWGFSAHPTALVRFWVAPPADPNNVAKDKYGRGIGYRVMIEYEAYGVGVDTDELPKMFDKVPDSRRHVIRADSARPETISALKRAGFRCQAAPKWKGSVEDGIAWLRGAEEIVIHDRCRHAAEEARNWSYKRDRLTGDVLPTLVDASDHIWDAVRYGASPLIRKRPGVKKMVTGSLGPGKESSRLG